MSSKIVAVVGSYRKDGAIDQAVEAVLEVPGAKGAQTHTIYLTIGTSSSAPTAASAPRRKALSCVKCVQQDDLESILSRDRGARRRNRSPVNYWNATALSPVFWRAC